MAIEKKLIKKALDNLEVKTFLARELERAGVSEIAIQKTPIATRIMAYVRKPGMVVGKKGKGIKDLCEALQQKFAIENPQFEVIEVRYAELDAKLAAEKIGRRIEVRPNFKPILRSALKEIMDAGAIGAEIRIAGKVVGKGGKAKTLTDRRGFLKKSGHMMTQVVREGHFVVYLKAGAVGITVKIVPPDARFSDKIDVGSAVLLPATETAGQASPQPVQTKEDMHGSNKA